MFKKNNVLFLILSCLIACKSETSFIAEGTVTDPAFEGSKIYMVALDGPLSKDVDSSIIKDGKFKFEKKSDSLKVSILRVPARFPHIAEDLVIITDPGKIDVVLAEKSHGSGTHLNNILQEWKAGKQTYDSLQNNLYSRRIMKGVTQAVYDSLTECSSALKQRNMNQIVKLMKENSGNGIGLLLFKLYYYEIPADLKKRILSMEFERYISKDRQLKLMVEKDRSME